MWKSAHFDFCLTPNQLLINFDIPKKSIPIYQMGFWNGELGIQFITAESIQLACFNLINIKTWSKISLHETVA